MYRLESTDERSPQEEEALQCFHQALEIEHIDAMKAVELYKKAFRLSPSLKKAYNMWWWNERYTRINERNNVQYVRQVLFLLYSLLDSSKFIIEEFDITHDGCEVFLETSLDCL